MSDTKVVKDIPQLLDEMSDEELIKSLQEAPDYGLGELLGNPFEWESTSRRESLGKLMNEQKLECPSCHTRQVQLVDYIDTKPAQWKCRHCKHNFEWEGEE